jgi:site-specific DNA recombinase
MCVAIYARVSTEKQLIEGFGLDVQMKELMDEAVENKLTYKKYVDSGITGTSIDKREGLQELLKDIKDGDIEEVWVTKLSRLGRNTRDVLNIIHEFERQNIVFKSKRDGIDTSTHMGKVMLQFMSIVSEMERDIIMETTRAGLEYRASLGKIYGCGPVLGYERIGSRKNSEIVINSNEAKIVKLIYSLFLKGYGYKAIVNELNRKNHKTKNNEHFQINSVKVVLNNPLYAGMIRYNYFKDWNKKRRKGKQEEGDYILVDGLHKGIIPKTKWNKVQKKMKTYYRDRRVIQSSNYLLSGILKCPECGGKMSGSKSRYETKKGIKEQQYYVCTDNRVKGKYVCSINSVKLESIDAEVLNGLTDFLSNIKDLWAMKLYEILVSDDLKEKKVLLGIWIDKINVDVESKQLKSIQFKCDEELFHYLKIKYSKSLREMLLNKLGKYNV